MILLYTWENGAALPDIQTMVGLTQLFGITVEQLLSGEIPEARLEEEKTEPTFDEHIRNIGSFVGGVFDNIGNTFRSEFEKIQNVDEPEVAEEPEDEEKKTIELKEILEMAPFMSKAAVAEMLDNCGQKLTPAQIARFAPYVDAACLEKLIRECDSQITWDSLRRIAPFLKKEAVDALARTIALGEKYVKPATGEVNRMAEDVCRTLDDVGRRIEKGVDKAVRKVVQIGENVVSEVSKAIEDLTSEPETRSERLARLRFSAFERALEDGKWDWITAHIEEVQDEDLLRRISEAANRAGMQDWLREHLGGYADPETIETAIAEGDWAWLGEHISGFDERTQRRVAAEAANSGQWDWLSACAEQMNLECCAYEIAEEARRAGQRMLAAQLVRYDVQPEKIGQLAIEAMEAGDFEFVGMIRDLVSEDILRSSCEKLARQNEWDMVMQFTDSVSADTLEFLMEIAIETGNFDAVDRMDALLSGEEEK